MLALRGFTKFRGQTGKELRTWLQQILRNAITQALRRSGATKRSDQATEPLAEELDNAAPMTSALVAGRQGFRQIIAAMVRISAATLQAVLSWATRRRLIARSPAASVEKPPRQDSLEQLTAEEAGRLLAELEKRSRWNRRAWCGRCGTSRDASTVSFLSSRRNRLLGRTANGHCTQATSG